MPNRFTYASNYTSEHDFCQRGAGVGIGVVGQQGKRG
jgi:hypothetical protein